jgi:hypothetical protein
MRLIDADLFEKEIKAVAQGQATSLMPDMVELSVETIVETLDEVPTAYDVDKVVQKLNEQQNNKGFGGTLQEMFYDSGLDAAIEIVKGGGIDGR